MQIPSHATVVAYIALFAALGGSSYAAVKINGKNIKNGTIAAKKLKKNTLGTTQVNESKLGKVARAGTADSAGTAGSAGSATRAASAATADNATNATNAVTAQKLGTFGPAAFAQASQIAVRGPFETDPLTGTDQDFFVFPEIDFAVKTPRAPNAPGSPGLVELQHDDFANRLLLHVRTATFEDVSEFGEGGSGINYPVNQAGDADFLEMTVVSLVSDFAVRIECVADDSVANMPVSCVATKTKP